METALLSNRALDEVSTYPMPHIVTAQDFVFRALELRQKIYFTDRENKTKYDQALVIE
jgi:hypothetical protein